MKNHGQEVVDENSSSKLTHKFHPLEYSESSEYGNDYKQMDEEIHQVWLSRTIIWEPGGQSY